MKDVFFKDRKLPIFSVVLSGFYDFHIDTFIYKGSAAIIGYCGLLTTSECVSFLLSSNNNACDVAHDIASMMNNLYQIKSNKLILFQLWALEGQTEITHIVKLYI